MKYCNYCEKGKKKPAQFLGSTYRNLKRDPEEYYSCESHVGKMIRRMITQMDCSTFAVRRVQEEDTK